MMNIKKFKKILIANRGEIAVRIIRTCREMGIETVAVHSVADESSMHVKMSDESVCIGPAQAKLSYLNIPSVLSAAEITEADAIHPGFGFLSENQEFALMCEKWGHTFIGPNVSCINDMGDKIQSKVIAEKAGIPILKPIGVNGRAIKKILADVQEMGLPVLIKSSAGGGGRGMKRVDDISTIENSLEKMKLEAKAGFGDDTLFIEKYIESPRHIEVQIAGDKFGNIVHFGERDCTIQRRFQKLIEESPSPVITESVRKEICHSAVELAKFVQYDSVGTVEFLYDQEDEKFYFMEMNTRIQVEHPVTEMRTNIDLIALQIRSAMGMQLNITQDDITFIGHALEVRINAEDPVTYAPSPGKILHYHRPAGHGIRVDDFVYAGYTVPPYYDSMISKIIVHGKDRDECLVRMERALNELVVEGISTNKELHKKIIKHPDFRGNNYATSFLDIKI